MASERSPELLYRYERASVTEVTLAYTIFGLQLKARSVTPGDFYPLAIFVVPKPCTYMKKFYILTFIISLIALLAAGKFPTAGFGLLCVTIPGCSLAWLKLQTNGRNRKVGIDSVRRTYDSYAGAGRSRRY